MSKILITGANSFIGTNFIHFSKFSNIEEVSLLDVQPENINFIDVEVVIHLAAIVHQSKEIPESLYFKINRDLCLRVAQSAKESGVKHFIFLSTVKVYGNIITTKLPFNEDSPCMPVDAYGKSKLAAEQGLKELENDFFTVSILRTPLVYGNGVKANMHSLLILVDKLPLLPFGNLKNKRSFTYIENIVGYIDRIIEKKSSGTFIALDENPLSTTELIRLIAASLEKKVCLFEVPQFLTAIFKFIFPGIYSRLYDSYEFENRKTLEILNFRPPVATDEGIKRMVIAYIKSKRV